MIKAMDARTDALPANPVAAVFKDVQGRAMDSRWKIPSRRSRSPVRSARQRPSKIL
jgi:hypothetical protein